MKEKSIIGMCFGTFDKLHKGHIDFFKQARKHCDELWVVIARDNNVKKIKGFLPRQNEVIRFEAINNAKYVDKAILGKIKNRYSVIGEFKPDIIFLGYDQKADIVKMKKYTSSQIVRLKPYKPEIYKSSKIK